ncbi:hypothetical protein CJ030_MR0G007784 [Morella rubra]|uniref:Protein kinase domain-containing protein n=1 Tax=Morella rubra TaxID=262757 RepID=A0A6A1UJ21_9ROSI|nr:hypothetical protein CJ030_MR0G007784 [Morella rubra]
MNQYQEILRIGEGVSGVVYMALDLETNKAVALKKLNLGQEPAEIPTTVIREISILKELQHENIVKLLDVVHSRKGLCLVFEYFDRDLKQHMFSSPEFSKDLCEAKMFLLQILRGIAYCHSHRVLHRDLKPRNLLIDSTSKVLKIADFGLARVFDSPVCTHSPKVGTPQFRAPELLLGSCSYSTPVDVWSAGCIFAEMVNQRRLFPSSPKNELDIIFSVLGTPDEDTWPGVTSLPNFPSGSTKFPPQDLARVFPSLDSDGIDLLSKMLCLNPSRRITARSALEHNYFKDMAPSFLSNHPCDTEMSL